MTESTGRRLRADVVAVEIDGGIAIYDAIFDRITRLDPVETAAMRAGDPAVWARLEQAFVADTPMARSILDATVKGRLSTRPRPGPEVGVDDVAWDALAETLPSDVIQERWRAGEPWRRLAEGRAAGREVLELAGLATPDLVAGLQRSIADGGWARARMDTDIVHGERIRVDAIESIATADDPFGIWFRTFSSEPLRALVGAVLGRAMPDTAVLNAWCFETGDFMAPHPDGKRYAGTLSLGLTTGLRAADGGAIAFGTPTEDGLDVSMRWLPHAGDACLFAPTPTSWHCVEPVASGPRRSLTGWWMLG